MVKIKGTAISDTLKRIKAKFGDEGVEQIMNSLSEESRAVFTDQTIIPSSFYSLDAFVELLECLVRLFHDGKSSVLTELSEELIERQLRGVYRIFVRLKSPESVATRVSNMNATYFNGITGEARITVPRSFVSRYYGFRSNHAIFEYCIIGYFQAALRICGAKNVRASFTTSIARGGPFSECTVTWD